MLTDCESEKSYSNCKPHSSQSGETSDDNYGSIVGRAAIASLQHESASLSRLLGVLNAWLNISESGG